MASPATATTGFDLTALDVPLRIEVDDAELGRLLGHLLGDLGSTGTPNARRISVTGQGPFVVSSDLGQVTCSSRPEAVSAALAAVNLTAVAHTPALALHAGVVARAGRALVLPGPSGHGKSTLVAALLRAGWDYVSDESLCLRWVDGALVAYPRPLGLSAWAADYLGVTGTFGDGERFVTAGDLGARAEPAPLEVSDVVLSQRGDATPHLEAADRSAALETLLRRGFTHHVDAGRALQVLSTMLQRVRVHRLLVGAPDETAAALSAGLSGGSA